MITGGELILKQEVVEIILVKLKNAGFNEKVSISQDELERIQEIASRNMGGSLFQENLILHIKHTSGKFPEKIKLFFELFPTYKRQTFKKQKVFTKSDRV